MLSYESTLQPNSLTFSSPYAYIVEQGQYFLQLAQNATTKEGKALVKRQQELYGAKFFQTAITFHNWFTNQSDYLIKKLFEFSRYLSEQALLKLPEIGDKFDEFLESLEEKKGDDGFVRLSDFGRVLRSFLPKRKVTPKFQKGQLLTTEHLNSFKNKVLGKTKNAELIAEREAFIEQVLLKIAEIAGEEEQKVEHLAEAIRQCDGNPIELLPKSKRYTDWEVDEMLNPYVLKVNKVELQVQDLLADRAKYGILERQIQDLLEAENLRNQAAMAQASKAIASDVLNSELFTIESLMNAKAKTLLNEEEKFGFLIEPNGSPNTWIFRMEQGDSSEDLCVEDSTIQVEFPIGSGNYQNLAEVVREMGARDRNIKFHSTKNVRRQKPKGFG